MERQKKENKSTKAPNVFVDKGESVVKFQEEQIPFSETENKPDISEKDALKLYSSEMKGKSLNYRFKLVLNTLGKTFPNATLYSTLITLYELLPYVCNNLHLIIVGDKGTGKTSGFTAYTDEPKVYFEAPTIADLRGSKISDGTTPALLEEILCLDEAADYSSSENISIIKSFESTCKFQLQGSILKESSCSIVICGNTMDTLNNFDDLNSSKLTFGLPKELTTEAFLNRQAGILYHKAVPSLTPYSFLSKGETGFNINIFLEALKYLKQNPRKIENFLISETLPQRECSIIKKAVTGLVSILYPDCTPPEYVLKGLIDSVLHFNGIANNRLSNPFNLLNTKFILELVKLDGMKIEEGYLLNNRILLKCGENFIKIPLNPFGVLENKKELKFFRDKVKDCNQNIFVAPIKSGSTEMKIIQEYYPLYSKNNRFDEEGEPIKFDYKAKKKQDSYNKLLIESTITAGRYNERIPEGTLKNWEILFEKERQNIIRNYFNLRNSIHIKNSVYSYDGDDKIIIINFADLI